MVPSDLVTKANRGKYFAHGRIQDDEQKYP